MIRIHDIADARGLLARAVLTQGPDFVYNRDTINLSGCFYTPSNADINVYPADAPQRLTPCLIGTALQLAGVTDKDLCRLTGRPSGNFMFWIKYGTVSLSRAVATYFTDAQEQQDAGFSWGESYQHAEASLEDNASEDDYHS